MQELKELLTGGHSGQAFLAAEIMAIVGQVMRMLVSALSRDTTSKRTPNNFNWNFFIQDSAPRFLFVFISTYLALRFGVELTPLIGIDPAMLDTNPALLIAFLIGLLNDWLVKKIINKIKDVKKK